MNTIKIINEIPYERVQDLLCSAFEGVAIIGMRLFHTIILRVKHVKV